MIRLALLWLRRYNAAIQLDAARKLLEIEQSLGAGAEHIIRAQALVNSRYHTCLQLEK
ncbi:MAG: hypothetical protein KGZ68_04650 [Dechloromonas sp.]|nr:hypothetical protein [Dechloromonas sp.]